ncbi:N-acetylglucosaminyltransferase [Diplodia intermedia]|uniref:N-acetylglucosaminyltransferase n=1 Tax=Diplodia intermedia TaxID=856260 RepID=A0ABR3U120_9PEZI
MDNRADGTQVRLRSVIKFSLLRRLGARHDDLVLIYPKTWSEGAELIVSLGGLAKQVLGSHVMLLEPNEHRHRKMLAEAARSPADFDMDVINRMFAMMLPHRRLALLSGEFRKQNHSE